VKDTVPESAPMGKSSARPVAAPGAPPATCAAGQNRPTICSSPGNVKSSLPRPVARSISMSALPSQLHVVKNHAIRNRVDICVGLVLCVVSHHADVGHYAVCLADGDKAGVAHLPRIVEHSKESVEFALRANCQTAILLVFVEIGYMGGDRAHCPNNR